MKLIVLIATTVTITHAVLTAARPIGNGMESMMAKRYLSAGEASSSAESVNSSPRLSFDSRASTSPNSSLDLGIDVGLVRRPNIPHAEPNNEVESESESESETENDRLRENFRRLYNAYPSDYEPSEDEAELMNAGNDDDDDDEEDDGGEYVADDTDDASNDDDSSNDADVSDYDSQ